jgi:hypothetical protein
MQCNFGTKLSYQPTTTSDCIPIIAVVVSESYSNLSVINC